jgi:hypothetical protein
LPPPGGARDEKVRRLHRDPGGFTAASLRAEEDVRADLSARGGVGALGERIGLDALRHGGHAEGRDDGRGVGGVLPPVRGEGAQAPPEGIDEGRPCLGPLVTTRAPGEPESVPADLNVPQLRAADGLTLQLVPAEREARLGPAPAHPSREEQLARGDGPSPELLLQAREREAPAVVGRREDGGGADEGRDEEIHPAG